MGGRRKFIKQTVISSIGLSMGTTFMANRKEVLSDGSIIDLPDLSMMESVHPVVPFVPRRIARWWTTLESLQWSQKLVRDEIKRRAEAFAAAHIDTVINGGCHIRFDFSNYFDQLHGYL